MPELPEVRTVAKVLNTLKNKQIKNINIIYPKVISNNSLDINLLINKTLKEVTTLGKYLLFDFEEYILISHLRMEGKYFIKSEDEEYIKHEHIALNFTDKTSLRYHDTRKFGRMQLVYKDKISEVPSLTKLANEPFNLDKEDFYKKVSKKRVPIKSILLDQTIINGLGNIYVNEVLFASSINPLTQGINLTRRQTDKIIDSSVYILNHAIKEGGTTIRSYTSSLGITGNYQNFLKVHLQENCCVCHNKIQNIKIGGRSTYYCSTCQK